MSGIRSDREPRWATRAPCASSAMPTSSPDGSKTRRTFPAGMRPSSPCRCPKRRSLTCCGAPRAVLPIGAQSSLTGGATPMGETARQHRAGSIASSRSASTQVRVQAGVTLADLDRALDRRRPVLSAARRRSSAPSSAAAVATNAAGAATFKYGTTRDWVDALTIVLPSGDVLDVERGAHARQRRRPLRAAARRTHGSVRCPPLSHARGRPSSRPVTSPRQAWTSSIC